MPFVKPVVGLDIDGTIGCYHDHFIAFAEQWIGREIRRGYDGTVSLAKWCGMSKRTYRECKLAFRQGGLKRSMPYYHGARDLTVGLRKAGAEVVICTTRPYLHLSNVEPDTLHSLRRNGIQYDGVIMGEHKYRQLAREYGKENVVMVLDDLTEQVDIALTIGLPAVLRINLHNINIEDGGYEVVYDLEQALDLGLYRIKEWKDQR